MKRAVPFCAALLIAAGASADNSELPPWLSAHGDTPPPPPAFLDTSDKRIRDDRPPPSAEQVKGLREMLEQLRKRRREALEQHDLGGVYDDIARELHELIDMEREAIEDLVQEARESGDARRQELTEQVAAERNASLDLLSPDLAGMVRDLQHHEPVTQPSAAGRISVSLAD